jgi:hypothetical protein
VSRFRVNGPTVIHETVDEETIIVNLDTGCYYDLNPVGAYLFELLGRGVTPEAASEQLVERYKLTPEAGRAAADPLLAELLAEGILVPSEAAGEPDVLVTAPDDAGTFELPVLTKHTDMQELLLLDPVHEWAAGEAPPDVVW